MNTDQEDEFLEVKSSSYSPDQEDEFLEVKSNYYSRDQEDDRTIGGELELLQHGVGRRMNCGR